MTEREIFFKHLGLPSATPIGLQVSRAEGIYIFDENNNKIVDLCSGVSVSNLGHNHPYVLQAVVEQVNKYSHVHVYGDLIQSPQVKLAKLLVDTLPKNLNCVYFVNSGTEANEGALKLARKFTGRYEFISFNKAYHGSSFGAMSVLGCEEYRKAYAPLVPIVKFIDFNDEAALDIISDKSAAVIVEPIQAEAGAVVPTKNFMKKLREKCTQTGTLLIFDEIQTGFGRTGKLFAFEHFEVVPDIITFAKAFGGGMPLGAFVASAEIMKVFQFAPTLGHITTFGGHPVCAAAGYASLDYILKNKIYETVEKKEILFREKLKHPKIKKITGKGLLLGVELESINETQKFLKNALKNGLLTDSFLFAPNKFRIAPPLIITEQEIENVSNLILKSLDD